MPAREECFSGWPRQGVYIALSRTDLVMAEAEGDPAKIAPHMSDDGGAEFETTAARVAEADQHATAYHEAVVCLWAA
jgi:hypothetical protein